MAVLIVVRHGQASFLEDEYDRLSELGESQSRLLGEYWAHRGERFDVVLSGPLKRQLHTAEIVAECCREAGHTLPDVDVVEEFMEFPAEQLAHRQLPVLAAENATVAHHIERFQASEDAAEKAHHFQEAYEALLARWARGDIDDPEIENYGAFAARVHRGYERAAEHVAEGRRVAVFTSAGPIAIGTQRALDLSVEKTAALMWRLRNSSMTEFVLDREALELRALNMIPHLHDEALWTHR